MKNLPIILMINRFLDLETAYNAPLHRCCKNAVLSNAFIN